MSTQRNHRAQLKRNFNSVKLHCSNLSYYQLLRSKYLCRHLQTDWSVYKCKIYSFANTEVEMLIPPSYHFPHWENIHQNLYNLQIIQGFSMIQFPH